MSPVFPGYRAGNRIQEVQLRRDEDMQFDPLNDAFVSIFNAEQAGHYEVTVKPASNLLGSLLGIMSERGYIGEYEKIQNRVGWCNQQVRRHQTTPCCEVGRIR